MSHILIVDDEASICWAFRESLADLGHHVEVAATAEEGLRIAGSNRSRRWSCSTSGSREWMD